MAREHEHASRSPWRRAARGRLCSPVRTQANGGTSLKALQRDGSDLLSGHGNEMDGSVAPYAGFLKLNGSVGNNLLVGGNNLLESLKGGPDSDRYASVDGRWEAHSTLVSRRALDCARQ